MGTQPEVYALYGPSGTGKSDCALQVADQHDISTIIDDGLLIYQGRKIAGSSAKYEKTKMQAVKRAVFLDPMHAQEVQEVLHTLPVERLLILGTSRKMVDKIVKALSLPAITRYIPITEVKKSNEIKAALYTRGTQGKHVIPIPQMQVEKHLIRRLIDSVEQIFNNKKEMVGERTNVMPRFQIGQIHLHENALRKLVLYSCEGIAGLDKFLKIQIALDGAPSATIHISLALRMGENMMVPIEEIRQKVRKTFSYVLNLELDRIDIYVDNLKMIME